MLIHLKIIRASDNKTSTCGAKEASGDFSAAIELTWHTRATTRDEAEADAWLGNKWKSHFTCLDIPSAGRFLHFRLLHFRYLPAYLHVPEIPRAAAHVEHR
jgi:hypothetical protein